jgi:hypothetical protein
VVRGGPARLGPPGPYGDDGRGAAGTREQLVVESPEQIGLSSAALPVIETDGAIEIYL